MEIKTLFSPGEEVVIYTFHKYSQGEIRTGTIKHITIYNVDGCPKIRYAVTFFDNDILEWRTHDIWEDDLLRWNNITDILGSWHYGG